MSEVIDNDFHPVDKGLEATDDHWGTQREEGKSQLKFMMRYDEGQGKSAQESQYRQMERIASDKTKFPGNRK